MPEISTCLMDMTDIPGTRLPFGSPGPKGPELWRATRLREAILRRELACLLQERAGLLAEVETLRASVERFKTQLVSDIASSSVLSAAPIQSISDPSSVGPAPARMLQPGEIAVAADFPPLFDMHSGGMRLMKLIEMMGRAGWSITFCSLGDRDCLPGVLADPDGRARYEDALRDAGVARICYGIGEIDKFLIEGGRHIEWAFLSFPRVAMELLPLVRSRCPTTRIAFDMVDFHGLRLAREAALRNDPDILAEAERQRDREVICARAADITLSVT